VEQREPGGAAAARERLDALTDNTSVIRRSRRRAGRGHRACLHREATLRRALSDPAQSGQAKAELAGGCSASRSRVLLGPAGRVGAGPLVAARDLVDAVEELADSADLIAAQRAGALDDVEDELFRFGRILSGDSGCAPRSPTRWPAARQRRSAARVARRAGTTGHRTAVTRLVTAPRGRSLESGIESLVQAAAARRNGWSRK